MVLFHGLPVGLCVSLPCLATVKYSMQQCAEEV